METERQIAVSLFLVLVMIHLQNRDVVIHVAFMKKQTDMDMVCTLLSITIFVSCFLFIRLYHDITRHFIW